MAALIDRTISSPDINGEGAPFYEAAGQGRFVLRWCLDCQRTHWYPRALCPHCFSDRSEWRDASGRATLHAFSVMGRADPPYVVAYVKLEEGPLMLTNVVNCDPDQLAIDQPLSVVFKSSDNGTMVPMFAPA